MRIRLIASLGEVFRAEEFEDRTAIVFDTLRATSNMAVALAGGAQEIVPAQSPEEAAALSRPGDLRGGERGGYPIPGFELGNSPGEYEPPRVTGKRIVMSTTNGTRAVHAAARANRLLTACLLNARACAEAGAAEGRDIVVLCSGTRGTFCLEDGLAAGAVLAELGGFQPYEPDEGGRAMEALYRSRAGQLEEALLASDSGVRLARRGHEADVRYCSRLNLLRTVPCLTPEGTLVAWTAS